MYSRTTFLKTLMKLNFFFKPVELVYNRKTVSESYLGLSFTLGMILVCIALVVYEGIDLITRRKFRTYSNEIYHTINPYTVFDSNTIAYSFYVDIDRNILIDSRVMNIEIGRYSVVKNIESSKKFISNYTPFEWEFCGDNLEKYLGRFQGFGKRDSINYYNYLLDLKFKDHICIKNDNISIGGDWTENILTSIYVKIHQCKNYTEDYFSSISPNNSNTDTESKSYINHNYYSQINMSNICKPQETINNIFSDRFFSVFYTDTILDTNNFNYPLSSRISNYYYYLSTSLSKSISLMFSEITVETEYGILFQESRNQTSFKFENSFEMINNVIINTQFNLLMEFHIQKTNSMKLIRREYMKLQELAAYVGGILKIYLIIGQIICNHFYEHWQYTHMINTFFGLPDENILETKHTGIRKSTLLQVENILTNNIDQYKVINDFKKMQNSKRTSQIQIDLNNPNFKGSGGLEGVEEDENSCKSSSQNNTISVLHSDEEIEIRKLKTSRNNHINDLDDDNINDIYKNFEMLTATIKSENIKFNNSYDNLNIKVDYKKIIKHKKHNVDKSSHDFNSFEIKSGGVNRANSPLIVELKSLNFGENNKDGGKTDFYNLVTSSSELNDYRLTDILMSENSERGNVNTPMKNEFNNNNIKIINQKSENQIISLKPSKDFEEINEEKINIRENNLSKIEPNVNKVKSKSQNYNSENSNEEKLKKPNPILKNKQYRGKVSIKSKDKSISNILNTNLDYKLNNQNNAINEVDSINNIGYGYQNNYSNAYLNQNSRSEDSYYSNDLNNLKYQRTRNTVEDITYSNNIINSTNFIPTDDELKSKSKIKFSENYKNSMNLQKGSKFNYKNKSLNNPSLFNYSNEHNLVNDNKNRNRLFSDTITQKAFIDIIKDKKRDTVKMIQSLKKFKKKNSPKLDNSIKRTLKYIFCLCFENVRREKEQYEIYLENLMEKIDFKEIVIHNIVFNRIKNLLFKNEQLDLIEYNPKYEINLKIEKKIDLDEEEEEKLTLLNEDFGKYSESYAECSEKSGKINFRICEEFLKNFNIED